MNHLHRVLARCRVAGDSRAMRRAAILISSSRSAQQWLTTVTDLTDALGVFTSAMGSHVVDPFWWPRMTLPSGANGSGMVRAERNRAGDGITQIMLARRLAYRSTTGAQRGVRGHVL